jgi:16S rRNA C967 or C1407 C5-methylase (RsmB/RsmF family)
MNLDLVLDRVEQDAFFQSIQQYAKRSIRLRVDRFDTALPFEVSDIPWYDWGRFLDDTHLRPATFLNYAAADYYIQDAASMLPLTLLGVQANDVVLDLCASPGGKASAIAEQLGPDGFLLANESIRSRVDVLRYALARTGNPTYATSSYDPEQLAMHAVHCFDAVLVDAPCSGQALVSRNKRDDNAFASHQIEHCVLRQRRILQAAARMVKKGGRMVYSTCTFAPEENELQIRWLQEAMPGCWQPLVSERLAAWQSPLEPGCYRLWPHRDACAGGFAAGLVCIQESTEPATRDGHSDHSRDELAFGRKKRRSAIEHSRTKRGREHLSELDAFIANLGQFRGLESLENSSGIYMTQGKSSHCLDMLAPLLAEATCVAVNVGKHRVPTQALAMMKEEYFQPLASVQLDPEMARAYIAGNTLSAHQLHPTADAPWFRAEWEGKPLGWLKSAGGRWNNHLPAWARLQID